MVVATGKHVAVLGCGLMGSALVKSLAKAGHQVTAWNRSPEKARALVGDGVQAVDSRSEAIASASVLVVCVGGYDDVITVLDGQPIDGATVVNVTTGTPEQAEQLNSWCQKRGARYLDGALIAYPEDIGTETCQVLFSGSVELWAELEPLLSAFGGDVRHVSDSVGGANVLDVSIVGAFYISALTAFTESAGYANAHGVSAQALLATTKPILQLLERTVDEAAHAVETREYGTDQATLTVYADAARSFVDAMRGAGHRATLLGAAVESLATAEKAGLGELGIFALRETSSKSDTHTL